MDSFDAEWLALREPADHLARDEALTGALASALQRSIRERIAGPSEPEPTVGASRAAALSRPGATASTPARVCAVDLAAGAGSNVRYLLPRLPQITHWTLVDHDAALLDIARRSLAPLADGAGATLVTLVADLRHLDTLSFDDCALVTASALLDLVSAPWLEALAGHCASVGAHALFTLTYDGRLSCTPEDPWDVRVRDLVNAHQRGDKGFGPALGPDATSAARAAFGAAASDAAPRPSFTVRSAASDWVLGAADAELQRQLVDGWAHAAREMAPDDAAAIAAWHTRRLDAITRGASTIRVGHQDLLAI